MENLQLPADLQMNETNQDRSEKLFQTLRESLSEALKEGFYGNLMLNCCVQNGIIQLIRTSVEKSIR